MKRWIVWALVGWCSMIFGMFLAAATGLWGFFWFAWTPAWAVWYFVDRWKFRRSMRNQPEDEFDQEWRDLLEREKNK